jgi:hypothetical protein
LPVFFAALPFGRQVGVVRDFAGRLFDFAFHFMNRTLNLIGRTRVLCFLPVIEQHCSADLHVEVSFPDPEARSSLQFQ